MKDTDLHPELAAYIVSDDIFGSILKHPLVFSIPYIPDLNSFLNLQFEHKKKAIADSLENKNFHRYIWLHERPYRLLAFLTIQEVLDHDTYSKLLAAIWIDSENIWQYKKTWIKMFDDSRFNPSRFMTSDEYQFFLSLPDRIKIYRGCGKNNRSGLSWTLDRGKAEWFASRFGGNIVLEKTVPKKSVLAYLSGRNEGEIILLRKK